MLWRKKTAFLFPGFLLAVFGLVYVFTLVVAEPLEAQVFSTIIRVPANGVAPNTQSFIPAGVPNLGPCDGALVFRRGAAPPSQACRINATVANPSIAELVVQQAFMQPDDGIGGTGATWGATILYRMLRTGSTSIRVVWDGSACGFVARDAQSGGQIRAAGEDQQVDYEVSATIDPQNPAGRSPESNAGHVGEPVNTFTGDLEDGARDPDIDLGGPLGLGPVANPLIGIEL